MSHKKIAIGLLLCFTALAQAEQQLYPYIDAKMLQHFSSNSKTGIGLDAFIPIIEAIDTKLFFSNVKINGYSNKFFDGGAYFGYRSLTPEQQTLYGIYAAVDFKHTINDSYFQYITLGTEYWNNKWFFSPKIFSPVGKNEDSYGKALSGISAEVGYELYEKSTVYLEGYYLKTFYTSNAPGVKIWLKQNLFNNISANLLNNIDLEAGVQADKISKMRVFLGLNFKLGAPIDKNSTQGVAKHMADTITRNGAFVFTENKPTIGIDKTRGITCYYDSYNLKVDDSSQYCPVQYSTISKSNNIVEVDKFYDSQVQRTIVTLDYTYTNYIANNQNTN